MKLLFATLMLALPLAVGTAFAQDKKTEPKKEEMKEMTPQQKKLGECSSAAKGLKGDEYKKKHADCMKGETAAKEEKKERTPQQQKMAECSSAAKGLKGDEYKQKHSDCMKK